MMNRWNKLGLRRRKMIKALDDLDLPMFVDLKCPICKSKIEFKNKHRIKVNIESEGYVKMSSSWLETEGCKNPMCEWSKVQNE